MGNQIVIPSGSNWYRDDLAALNLRVEHSLYDGSLNLSFKASNLNNKQFMAKAFQLWDKDSIIVAKSFCAIFDHMQHIPNSQLFGNIISKPVLNNAAAYLVRPYFDTPLSERIEYGDTPLCYIEKLWISYQIIQALNALHEQGFRHGDIKPENVLLTNQLFINLVDHSPYKPERINRNHPHYLIHYFTYGRNSVFLAPERMTKPTANKSINPFSADIFSAGCVIAFIFLDGIGMFSLTSLMAYADGDNSLLQPLEQIEPKEMRDLCYSLLDRDTEIRFKNFKNAASFFPDWIKRFFEICLKNDLPNCDLGAFISIMKEISSIIPEDVSDEVIIILNILASHFNDSGTISSLSALIHQYTYFAGRINDTEQLLTKIIPPLVELLSRGNNVICIHTLDAIISILRQIDTIPENYQAYLNSYLIKNLVKSMKKIHNWRLHVVSNMSFLILEFSRLWPSFYLDITRNDNFFLPMSIKRVESSIIKRENRITLAKSFFASASKLANLGNYKLMKSLTMIIMRYLKSPQYFHLVIPFINQYYDCLKEEDKRRFINDFIEEYQKFLLTFDSENKPDPLIFCEFAHMIENKMIDSTACSAIALHALKYIISEDQILKTVSNMLFNLLPEQYKVIRSAQWYFSKIGKPIDSLYVSDSISAHNSKSKSYYRSVSTPRFINVPKSVRCAFFTQTKLQVPSVQNVFFDQNSQVVVQHSHTRISRYKINSRMKFDYIKTHDFCRIIDQTYPILVPNSNNILVQIGCDFIVNSGQGNLATFSLPSEIQKACVSENNLVYTEEYKNQIFSRDLVDFSMVSTINTKIYHPKIIKPWRNTPFLAMSSDNGLVFIIDPRIESIIGLNSFQPVDDILTLSDYKIAIKSANDEVEFYDLVAGRTELRVKGKVSMWDSSAGRTIMTDSTGTFMVTPEFSCYSLFDRNRYEELDRKIINCTPVVTLPDIFRKSLHKHLFPISTISMSKSGTFCLTSDAAGYIHLWSPTMLTMSTK